MAYASVSSAPSVSSDQCDDLNVQASDLLERGDVHGFNALRAAHPEWQPMFEQMVFFGHDFTGADFRGCEFASVSFFGVRLRDACFKDATFYAVDFMDADLEGVRGLTAAQVDNLLSRGGPSAV